MAGHDDEIEFLVPAPGTSLTQNPLDIYSLACPPKHRLSWVEPAKPPGMASLPSAMEQRPRPAADVEDRLC